MSVPGAELAKAHRFPIPAPAALLDDRDNSILVRYDGVTTKTKPLDGSAPKPHQIVWFVVPGSDLAKLPETALDGLDLAARQPDGGFTTSKNAFFVSSTSGVSLYVDSEVHEPFLDRLCQAADASGLKVFNARGDIARNMLGADGDIAPPLVPAYVANGHTRMPTVEALDVVREMRAERAARAVSLRGADADAPAAPTAQLPKDIWAADPDTSPEDPKPY